MWKEVIAANVQAIGVGSAYAAQHKHAAGGCGHCRTWLIYADLQEKRSVDALDALTSCRHSAATAAALPAKPVSIDPDNSALSSYVYMRLLQLVETGRDEPTQRLHWSSPGHCCWLSSRPLAMPPGAIARLWMSLRHRWRR